MNNKLTFFNSTLLTVAMIFSLSSCQVHSHTFSSEWTTDNDYHWHSATCEHQNNQADKEAHSWDSGTKISDASCDANGLVKFTCTVCKKEKLQTINATHNFANTFSYDEYYHWQPATCSHENEKNNLETHTWINKEDSEFIYTCSVCGFEAMFMDDIEEVQDAILYLKNLVPYTIFLAEGTYTIPELAFGGKKNITILPQINSNVTIDGQLYLYGEENITLKNITLTNANAVTSPNTNKSQFGICVEYGATINLENCIYNVKGKNTSAIHSYGDDDSLNYSNIQTHVNLNNCTFNCGGERALQISGNLNCQNCIFNDQYRYSVQFTCKDQHDVNITFKNNIINDAGKTSGKPGYALQLNDTYKCQNMIIECENNVFTGILPEICKLYVYDSGLNTLEERNIRANVIFEKID